VELDGRENQVHTIEGPVECSRQRGKSAMKSSPLPVPKAVLGMSRPEPGLDLDNKDALLSQQDEVHFDS
jgi:hypothetical protein